MRLDDFSEPQPDFAVLAPRDDFYESRSPRPADTLLVIEVSDSSLSYDLERKVPLYARHGIPEVWIVDVNHKRVHAYREPGGAEYEHTSCLQRPATMALAFASGMSVELSAVFGSA